MTTSRTLNEIQATPKQYFGLAGKFAYLLCESQEIPQIKFSIIRKRVLGVLHSQFPASSLSRGKAQELFETAKIPAFLTRQVKTEDMVGAKAPVKVKAVKKTTKVAAKAAKPTATKVAKKKVAKKSPVKKRKFPMQEFKALNPTAKAASKPTELETRMTFLEGEVSQMSEDVNLIKSTLDQLVTQLKLG